MLIPTDPGVDRPAVHQFFRRTFADALNSARRRALSHGQADDGFTLLEMMVALFVFAILASGFAMTMGGSLKAFQRSRVKTLGEQIANDKLEDARRMPYDSLGNLAGNPLGTIPFTQTQNVGGYTFTVGTDVSFVNDPVPSMLATATYADYKLVTITVTSATGAPPVTMSTFVAPPAKPAVDKGRVSVTVSDIIKPQTMSGVKVDLVNGATTRTDTTNANGLVVFPALTPSANIPAVGVNDWFYVNPSVAFPLPVGYWVYPASDSTIPAGSANKFTVAAATSTNKQLNIYKAAVVSVLLKDNQGAPLYDAATVTVTANGGLGSSAPLATPAGGVLPAFSTVAGRGIIPDDTLYDYTFAVSAGGNCFNTVTPATLESAAYPVDTAINVSVVLPCDYTTVKLHLKDQYDGSPIANTDVTVSLGPIGAGFTRTITTDASGNLTLRVQVGTAAQQYKISTVAVANGRSASSTNFTATYVALPGVLTVPDISVGWPTKVITATLKDGYTGANIIGGTVNITGGPTAGTFTSTPATTNASGQVTFTVPCGTPFAAYSLTVPPDAAGRLGIAAPGTSVASTCGSTSVTLTDPWTMMPVNVTVTDALTGLPISNTAVLLTAGPPGVVTAVSSTTNAAGLATFSVPAGTAPTYTLNIAAVSGGRLAATTTFSPVGPGPVAVPMTVAWPMNTLTVTVRGSLTTLPLAGRTVQISGGPDGYSPPSQVTLASGQVTFNLPVGATAYTITVPTFAGFPASVSSKVVTVSPTPNVATATVVGA